MNLPPKPQLVNNAGSLWWRLWSMRFIGISTLLSSIAAGMSMFETKNIYVVIGAIAANILAAVFRMIQQPKAYAAADKANGDQ